jgi:CheY-like chemotaxis protein
MNSNAVETRRRRILVIDDRPDMVDAMQCVLELAGHDVDIAYDGQGAIRSAFARHPEVILCDIDLPGHDDGHAVAEAVRASPQLRSTYMLAVTGCDDAEDVKKAMGAGFDLHVAKPVDMHVLLRLIDERFEESA